ncbi:acyltransferase [Nocardioides sp. GY 10127]|uniref:acyltransferase family protein n=1 Tax=Nocardioides sp. GY 10127 TaxID=2569762 RepID=UPI0010A81178|nr:acyltransferase [Nocardioides sp. GY 10127]TIC81800.1 acyltransferase [Nocardioides sp. GY 10127]
MSAPSATGRTRAGLGFRRPSHRPGARSATVLVGVTGWRSIAALLVVVFHVWQNMGTDGTGVGPWTDVPAAIAFFGNVDLVLDLFFVLSGLLLFLPFAQAALDDARPAPAWRTFLWRRSVRLFPLYWVVVVLAWSTYNYGITTARWDDLLVHLALLQAWSSELIFYTIGPAWTLSVEWMFYLALAALGPLLVRRARLRATTAARVRLLVAALLGVVAASVAYKLCVELWWQPPVTDWAWRFGPPAKADDFAYGMLAAVVVVLVGRRGLPAWLLPVPLAGALWLFSTALVLLDETRTPIQHALRTTTSGLAWAIVLLALATCRQTWPGRLVDNPLTVRLSVVTYALYLVHEPVLLAYERTGLFLTRPTPLAYAVNLAVVLPLALAAAWVLHRLVEEPWTDLAAWQAPRGGRARLYPDRSLDLAAHRIRRHAALADLGTAPARSLRDQVDARLAATPGGHRPGATLGGTAALPPSDTMTS